MKLFGWEKYMPTVRYRRKRRRNRKRKRREEIGPYYFVSYDENVQLLNVTINLFFYHFSMFSY